MSRDQEAEHRALVEIAAKAMIWSPPESAMRGLVEKALLKQDLDPSALAAEWHDQEDGKSEAAKPLFDYLLAE